MRRRRARPASVPNISERDCVHTAAVLCAGSSAVTAARHSNNLLRLVSIEMRGAHDLDILFVAGGERGADRRIVRRGTASSAWLTICSTGVCFTSAAFPDPLAFDLS